MPVPSAGALFAQISQTISRVAELLSIDIAVVAQRALQIAGVLALAWVLYRGLRLLTRRIERVVEDSQRATTLAQLLNSVGAVAITIGAGLTILNFFIAIAPLLAGVGVAGLAISFGAQGLVKDVISGFFILLENQFGVGDIIEINGVGGVVERMTMRVVMLRDVQGVLHVIPNGGINLVSNKTRGWSRAVLDIGVAYKEDVDRVIRVMRDVARELWTDAEWRRWLIEEPAVWGVETLADSAVNIRIIANVQPGKQWDVGRELRRRIKNRFDSEGIELPFPQRKLHFGDGGALREMLAARSEESGAPQR